MSASSVPVAPARGAGLESSFASGPSSSLWSRMTAWATENKAIVYTVAGVAVIVTGAGVVYYLSESSADGDRRAGKREKRKARREKDNSKAETKVLSKQSGGTQLLYEHSESSSYEVLQIWRRARVRSKQSQWKSCLKSTRAMSSP